MVSIAEEYSLHNHNHENHRSPIGTIYMITVKE